MNTLYKALNITKQSFHKRMGSLNRYIAYITYALIILMFVIHQFFNDKHFYWSFSILGIMVILLIIKERNFFFNLLNIEINNDKRNCEIDTKVKVKLYGNKYVQLMTLGFVILFPFLPFIVDRTTSNYLSVLILATFFILVSIIEYREYKKINNQ